MKATIIFLILLTISQLYLTATSLWRAGHLRHLGITLALAAGAYVVGLLVTQAIEGEIAILKGTKRAALFLKPKIFLALTSIAAGVFSVAAVLSLSKWLILPDAIYCLSGAAAVVFGLSYVAINAVKRHQGEGAPRPPVAREPERAVFFSGRVIPVFAATLVAEFFVIRLVPLLRSFILVQVFYYSVMAVSGAALGAWCRSKKHVPILTATFVLLLVSGMGALIFLKSPSARFTYGPEITIFAIEGHLSRMMMLPLDAVVSLSSWRIAFGVSQRRRRRPRSPESPPSG